MAAVADPSVGKRHGPVASQLAGIIVKNTFLELVNGDEAGTTATDPPGLHARRTSCPEITPVSSPAAGAIGSEPEDVHPVLLGTRQGASAGASHSPGLPPLPSGAKWPQLVEKNTFIDLEDDSAESPVNRRAQTMPAPAAGDHGLSPHRIVEEEDDDDGGEVERRPAMREGTEGKVGKRYRRISFDSDLRKESVEEDVTPRGRRFRGTEELREAFSTMGAQAWLDSDFEAGQANARRTDNEVGQDEVAMTREALAPAPRTNIREALAPSPARPMYVDPSSAGAPAHPAKLDFVGALAATAAVYVEAPKGVALSLADVVDKDVERAPALSQFGPSAGALGPGAPAADAAAATAVAVNASAAATAVAVNASAAAVAAAAIFGAHPSYEHSGVFWPSLPPGCALQIPPGVPQLPPAPQAPYGYPSLLYPPYGWQHPACGPQLGYPSALPPSAPPPCAPPPSAGLPSDGLPPLPWGTPLPWAVPPPMRSEGAFPKGVASPLPPKAPACPSPKRRGAHESAGATPQPASDVPAEGGDAAQRMARDRGSRRLRLWAHIYLHMQAPGFDLVPRLIGRGGCNMRRIADETGAKLRIRGRGSGHLEIDGKHEAPTPLMVAVTTDHVDDQGFKAAIEKTLADLAAVEQRFLIHCKKQNIEHSGPCYSIGLLPDASREALGDVINQVPQSALAKAQQKSC